MPSQRQILEAQLQGIKSTLERIPPKEKTAQIALALAGSFNDILTTIGESQPDLKGFLPKPLSMRGKLTVVGKAEVTYLDLEVFCEQTINLLRLVPE